MFVYAVCITVRILRVKLSIVQWNQINAAVVTIMRCAMRVLHYLGDIS